MPEARGHSWEEQPLLQAVVAARVQEGLEELFQILKDDAVKVLHTICPQIWKLSSGHRTGKGQFSFQSQKKAMPKNA